MKKAMLIFLVLAACGGGSPSFFKDAGAALAAIGSSFDGSAEAQVVSSDGGGSMAASGSQTLTAPCDGEAAKFENLSRELIRSAWRCGAPAGTEYAGMTGTPDCAQATVAVQGTDVYVSCPGWDHVELVIAP